MLTRRGLLATSGAAAAGILLRCSAPPSNFMEFDRPLPIPPLIDAAANGGAVKLTVGAGRHAFWPDKPVGTYG